MARKIIAGNWKMNVHPAAGVDLIKEIATYCENTELKGVEVVIAPSFLELAETAQWVADKKMSVAAQNCSEHNLGAFTGEVNADMIQSTGAELVLIGHSERRQFFGDTNSVINQKLKQALRVGLFPILCVGETLEQRQGNQHETTVLQQLEEALAGFEMHELENLTIAYEPVWAIGTGETASPEQAQTMHNFIRVSLGKMYNASLADETSILYGGSVNPKNANDLFGQEDIDGGLIGGASLKFESFSELISIGVSVLA